MLNWYQAAAVDKRRLKDAKRDLLFFLSRVWFLLRKNRLLFWSGVITSATLLGGSLALLTPLWSNRNSLNQEHYSGSFAKTRSPVVPYQLSRSVNILVMGIDPFPGARNTSPENFTGSSDTILLLQLNPNDKTVKVLSIPKDSQVVVPGVGLAKISLANSLGGSSLAARVVSRTLNNVPIDRYVRVTTNAFRELVDQLGGVEVFVPQKMSYRDATQKLEIDLDPGWQTLNGSQAEQFARFRDSSIGEITRVQRQQSLLKALRDRLTSSTVLPRLPQLSHMIQNYVDTNLSLEEMLALANFCVGLNQENLHMVLLPGNLSPFSQDPSSYWLDSSSEQNRIMGEYFGVRAIGVTQKTQSFNTLKIAVQNASGQSNLSQSVVNYLKNQGFNNVYSVSDWRDVQRQTEIIAQQGNEDAATNLKQILGLGNIEASSTGDLKSYLTIRVGKDWVESATKQNAIAGTLLNKQ
jgi:LCP family protein required for cell wall assembly